MNDHNQNEVPKGERLKKRVISLSVLILIIAITVTLFIFLQQNPDKIKEFQRYGYLGAFIISLVSTSTVILPAPGILLVIALGATLNPVLLGIVSAVGGSIGELTGYVLGYSGRGIARSNIKLLVRAEGWMHKRGFLTVFLFSLIPFLPFDVVGVVSGALRFPIWKFLLACFLGKTVLNIVLIQTGTWGLDALLRYLH